MLRVLLTVHTSNPTFDYFPRNISYMKTERFSASAELIVLSSCS